MTIAQSQPWEIRLLSAAQEALISPLRRGEMNHDEHVLDSAYRSCEQITYDHSRTFYMASALLPRSKRKAVRALYAFCRTTDDIVDDASRSVEERREALANWKQMVMGECRSQDSPVFLAWANTQEVFRIPSGYASQLIDGCARDLVRNRYDTFDELAEYAYGVASTVGLMAMHIIGYNGVSAIPYAVRLGVALQITNILRDVAEDWKNGRVYLPQQELAAYGLSDADIELGRVSDQWREFMKFQIQRNRELYQEGLPGVALLRLDGRFAIEAAAELYRAILQNIEANGYNVFIRRARISTVGKLLRLPGIWLRSRRAGLNHSVR
jgi:15-cis-phytoene synthase